MTSIQNGVWDPLTSPTQGFKSTNPLQVETSQSGPASIAVFSVNGALISQWQATLTAGINTIDAEKIGMEYLPAGIYFLSVLQQNKIKTTKFIKP